MDQTPLVIRRNITRYRAMLENETDESKREMLRRLIADCEAELPQLKRLSFG